MKTKVSNCEVVSPGKPALVASKAMPLKVLVGYGWQKFHGDDPQRKGKDVLYDTFWTSLRGLFRQSCDNFKKLKDGTEISVSLKRLRASHGRFVWPTIEQRIGEADLLIFDVAEAPKHDLSDKTENITKSLKRLNSNVLLEIGYALGRGKRVFLMCPSHLFQKVPSDLQGFLWTLYTGSICNGELTRTLVDEYGTMNAFRGMLREIAHEKLNVECDD